MTKTSSLNESLRSENAKLLCSKRNLIHKSSSDQKKIALHYDNLSYNLRVNEASQVNLLLINSL